MSLYEAPCTLVTPHEGTFVALLTLQPTSMQNGNICLSGILVTKQSQYYQIGQLMLGFCVFKLLF